MQLGNREKQTSEALANSKRSFRALFNIMPDSGVILDSAGKFLDVTDKVKDILGYERGELLGRNVFATSILTGRNKATLLANLAKRMMGMYVAPYETELQTKDGRKLSFEINATKIEYDGKPANLILFRDLSERNKLKMALEKEEDRFRDIANSIGDWIWEINVDGKYVYSSALVEKILGYTPEEVIGQHFTSFLLVQEPGQLKKAIEIFDRRERFIDFACKVMHKNGDILSFEKNAIPKLDPNGEFLGYRGVDHDVSERNQMKQQLIKSERFVAIGELAAMIAHDLRNPLQGIANGTYFLKRKILVENDQKAKEVFELVQEAVQYSNKIIDDLLEYSREIHLDFEETTPKSLVNIALSAIATPVNLRVLNKVESETALKVDLDKMKRVFINIIKNGIDAMPNGGALILKSVESSTEVQFLFSDDGIGMTRETMEKLWNPLFTTKAKGMGFGLSICKRIVEAHEGKISVESVFGEGTTFAVTIPLYLKPPGGEELWVNPLESLSSTTTKL